MTFLESCIESGLLMKLADDLDRPSDEMTRSFARFVRQNADRIHFYNDPARELPSLIAHWLIKTAWTKELIREQFGDAVASVRLELRSPIGLRNEELDQSADGPWIGASFAAGESEQDVFLWSGHGRFQSGSQVVQFASDEINCAGAASEWRFLGSVHGPIAAAALGRDGPAGVQRWLLGHDGPVDQLLAVPRSNQLWSFGADRTVRRWDVRTGRLLETLSGHVDRITDMAISDDELRLVSVSLDGTLRAWSLTDADEPAFVGNDNGGSLNGVAISPKGDIAYAASQDGSVRVWDLEEGTLRDTWRGHEAAVTGVALSANGRMLVSWSMDRHACLWTTESLELSKSLEHDSEVTAARFLPDGQVLTVDADGRLWLWRLGSGKLVRRLFGHRGRILTLDVNEGATRALTCGSDRTVRLWSLEDGQMLEHWGARLPGSRTLFGVDPGETVRGRAPSKGDSAQESWGEPPKTFIQLQGRKARRINAQSGDARPLRSKQVLEGDWHRMTRDGRYLLIVGHGVLTCHRIPALHESSAPKGWRHKPRIPVVGCEVSPGSSVGSMGSTSGPWPRPATKNHLISWDRENTIFVHDAESGKVRSTLSGHDRPITAAVVDQQGRAISASAEGVCHVWDLEAGESRQVRTESSGEAVLGLILRDGEDTALSWTRSSIARWSVSSGSTMERHKLPSEPTRVRRPTQGSWLVAGTVSGQMVWIGHPSRGRWVVRAHPDPVADVVIADNDEWIVTGSEGGDICLWEVETGDRIGVAWVDSPVRHLAAIGEHLAALDRAGNVTLFEVTGSRLKPGEQPG
ncbi:MAG: WD40 repeat domain-containing protein [Planctomycetota bacterium]